MKPVIPRVRVGDILKGTKNLRHYLQTASTLNYLLKLTEGARLGKRRLSPSYHPSREERYLVTVNNPNMFMAWGIGFEVVLMFINPISEHLEGPLKKSSPDDSGLKLMDPTIFSLWFIRTSEKMTNLKDWPAKARFVWMAFHLNLTSARGESVPLIPLPPRGRLGPFTMDNYIQEGGWGKEELSKFFELQVVRGVTRPNASWSRNRPARGWGPRLEEIESMREEIRLLCSNPRVVQQLKEADDNNSY